MDNDSILVYYLLGVNFITFLLMRIDKRKAKSKQWRIPERTFFMLGLLGGAVGVLCGMKIFRHKTKQSAFKIGMPLFILFHLSLLLFYFNLS